MKFSLVLTGAAVASAAVVPKDAPAKDYCPAVKKTVKLTWVEAKVYESHKVVTVSYEDAKKKIDNSKFVPGYVYNVTKGYPTKASSITTKKPSSTGLPYGHSTGIYFPSTSGYRNGTATATSKYNPTGATSASATYTEGSATSSAPQPSATLDDGECTNPAIRKEWRGLSDGEKDSYISAIRCLMNRQSSGNFPGSRSRWEDLASWHQQLTPTVHSVGQFLPFHRYYLHVFEQVIREECGYTAPLPWWDETLDAGHFGQAPLFSERWFGPMPEAVDGRAVCVSGGWGDYNPTIGPGYEYGNERCLSRAVREDWTANTGIDATENCRRAANYDDYRWCFEAGPHAFGHNGVGAAMMDMAASPVDPLFELHHGYVDAYWVQWQDDQPWNRLSEIGGTDGNGGQTTPDYVLHSFGIRPETTVGQVLNAQGGYLCYKYEH